MAEERNKGAGAALAGVGVGAIGAWLLSGKVSAAPPGVDPKFWEALLALIATVDSETQALKELITLLQGQGQEPGQLTFQGYPPNVDDVEITRITINALVTAYQLPDIAVPDGFTIVIKAWPTNAGLIYVARSAPDARNVAQVFPLLPNDFVGEAVTNADVFYISGTAVGDFASVLVGHRKGGG